MNNNNNPARLGKGEAISENTFESWLLSHAHIILPLLIILLIIMIIGVVIVACDISSASSTPAMVESGNYYYHLKDVI